MLEYPHGWQLLGYDFLYPNIRPQKKKKLKKKKKKMSRPTPTRTRESGVRWHGTVGTNVSQLEHCQTHLSETGTKCPDFCLDLEENGLFCHLWFLKQHCLLLLFLLKSAPSTATQSKVAMRFQRGTWETAEWYGSGKKRKKRKKIQKSKNSKKKSKKFKKKIKKFKKNQKNSKKL